LELVRGKALLNNKSPERAFVIFVVCMGSKYLKPKKKGPRAMLGPSIV